MQTILYFRVVITLPNHLVALLSNSLTNGSFIQVLLEFISMSQEDKNKADTEYDEPSRENGLEDIDFSEIKAELTDEKLDDFVNEYYIEDPDIIKYGKFARLRNSLISSTLILMMTMMVAFSIFVSQVDIESLGSMTIWQDVSFKISTILFSSIYLIALIPLIGSRVLLRKSRSMEFSPSAWTNHRIASAIRSYRKESYHDVTESLNERNIHQIYLHDWLKKFKKASSETTLTSETDNLVANYVSKLNTCDDIENALGETFVDFIYPITREITAVDDEDLRDTVGKIDKSPRSEVTYKEILKDVFLFDVSPSSRVFRAFMLFIFAMIGFAVFYFIDDTLGMLTTVVLYSSFEILIGSN